MANIEMVGNNVANVLWMAMESELAYVTWRTS
jgi:hypothetical protein